MLTQRDKDVLIHIEKYHAITIKQAHRIFYNKDKDGNEVKFGYDVARKRLKQLEQMGLLKNYLNLTTNEKVYYGYEDRKVSAHDLFIMDFYSMLYLYGCKNTEFTQWPRYLKNMVRPDGFFKFEYAESLYFILLEVDLTHITTMGKFQLYEKLFREKELHKQCHDTFPQIVVMGFDGTLKYESENFEVVYSDFNLSNFESKILGTA